MKATNSNEREIVVYADRYSRNNITTSHNKLIEITTAPEIYFFRPIDIASKCVLVDENDHHLKLSVLSNLSDRD